MRAKAFLEAAATLGLRLQRQFEHHAIADEVVSLAIANDAKVAAVNGEFGVQAEATVQAILAGN